MWRWKWSLQKNGHVYWEPLSLIVTEKRMSVCVCEKWESPVLPGAWKIREGDLNVCSWSSSSSRYRRVTKLDVYLLFIVILRKVISNPLVHASSCIPHSLTHSPSLSKVPMRIWHFLLFPLLPEHKITIVADWNLHVPASFLTITICVVRLVAPFHTHCSTRLIFYIFVFNMLTASFL